MVNLMKLMKENPIEIIELGSIGIDPNVEEENWSFDYIYEIEILKRVFQKLSNEEREEEKIEIFGSDELPEKIEEKLLDGWIMLTGPHKIIQKFGEKVWPSSNNFQTMIFSVNRNLFLIGFIKENKELWERINEDPNDHPHIIGMFFSDEIVEKEFYKTTIVQHPNNEINFKSFIQAFVHDFIEECKTETTHNRTYEEK